jgi:hypothetical protein
LNKTGSIQFFHPKETKIVQSGSLKDALMHVWIIEAYFQLYQAGSGIILASRLKVTKYATTFSNIQLKLNAEVHQHEKDKAKSLYFFYCAIMANEGIDVAERYCSIQILGRLVVTQA